MPKDEPEIMPLPPGLFQFGKVSMQGLIYENGSWFVTIRAQIEGVGAKENMGFLGEDTGFTIALNSIPVIIMEQKRIITI